MMTLEEIYESLKTKDINEKAPFAHKIKTKNKVINMSLGRIWFNLLTPDDYKLVDDHLDKGKLSAIINEIYEKYSPEETGNFINKLNRESFKLGTIIPSSFDIDALVIPDHIIEKKNKLLIEKKDELDPGEVNKIAYELAEEYLEYIKEEYDSGIYDVLMSGAKGSPADWALLMIAKGSPVDIEGKIYDPILHSLDDGLSLEEYYLASAEARSNFYKMAVGSAEPGYLASQTAYANSSILLTGKDCKTKNYFNLEVTKSTSERILGRFYLNEKTNELEEINESNYSKLVGKKIKLRSPLYCKDKDGICETCYGRLGEILGTKKIGLLTASTVNDQGIQSAMKSRHLTTQVNIKKANFTKDIIT